MSHPDDLDKLNQGVEPWNDWIRTKGTDDIVDLSGEDLGRLDMHGYEFLVFADFSGCVFERLHLSDTTFNRGVDFSGAEFRGALTMGGRTRFDAEATFNNCRFLDTVTYEPTVSFVDVYFIDAQFHGVVDIRADIKGHANFSRSHFFGYTQFLSSIKGIANFSGCCFESGVSYKAFSQNAVSFANAKFQEMAVFDVLSFRDVDFTNTRFEGLTKFLNVEFSKYTFLGASFRNTPDFVTAKFETAPSFQGVTFEYKNTSSNTNYAWLLRRLKSLAIEGSDHEKELEFFAREMKEKRRHELSNWGEISWNFLYELTSNYGTSWIRPLISLVLTYTAFFLLYQATIPEGCCLDRTYQLLYFAYSHLLVLPTELESQKSLMKCAFGDDGPPASLMFYTSFEGLCGLVFLFLFLLAIRNKFKIK